MFDDAELAELYDATDALAQPMTHVTVSGVQTPVRGVFAAPGKAVFDGSLYIGDTSVRYPLAAWPAVKAGDGLIVGARTYKVRENPVVLHDGREATIYLSGSKP